MSQSAPVAAGTGATFTINCPSGKQAVGGGADSPAPVLGPGSTTLMLIDESKPIQSGARSVGWYLEVVNLGDPQTITAYAVCSK